MKPEAHAFVLWMLILFVPSLGSANLQCFDLFAFETAREIPTGIPITARDAAVAALGELPVVSPEVVDVLRRYPLHNDARAISIREKVIAKIEARDPNEFIVVLNGGFHGADISSRLGPRTDVGYITATLHDVQQHPLILMATKIAALPLNGKQVEFVDAVINTAIDHVLVTVPRYKDMVANIRSGFSYSKNLADQVWASVQSDSAIFEIYPSPLHGFTADPSTIIINELHYLNSVGFLDALPSSQALKSRGVERISFMLEGFPSSIDGSPYRQPVLLNVAAVNLFTKAMKGMPAKTRTSILNANDKGFKEAVRLLSARPTVINPNLNRLIEIIETYARAGIRVTLYGLG